ncbi:hypothetical protein ACGF5M_00145 [Gemmatimonadota bacterium]
MSDRMEFYRSGERWPEHYRGSRYHFNPDRKVWWYVPSTESKVLATGGHEDLVEALLAVRPKGGSFRITETGAVITKRSEDEEDWEPIYVGEFEVPIEFEHVDVLGRGIQSLDLWPCFYDGARYSYKRGQLWWKNPVDDEWQRTVESLPASLEKAFLEVKPSGGSLRITENGKVLTLIVPQPLPQRFRPQYEALSNVQKRLIEVKMKSTERLPVYLGEYFDGFNLHPAQKLTDPLSPDEEAEIVSFLNRYGDAVEAEEADPFDPDDELENFIEGEDL